MAKYYVAALLVRIVLPASLLLSKYSFNLIRTTII